jgi:hypothetical protein
MSNDLTLPTNDGWGDAAAEADENLIRGRLLKFSDWRWTAGKEAELIEEGSRFVALATTALWQRWQGGRPVESRMREPGKRLPDREDLGYEDESEWEEGPGGERQDPWRNTRLVYLVVPKTAEAFTFTTSSWGGRGAVATLGDQIARMRTVHADAVPIVELRAAEMPTRHGRKSKPVFKIVAWRTADNEQHAPVERQITARQAEREVAQRDMDDEIPW